MIKVERYSENGIMENFNFISLILLISSKKIRQDLRDGPDRQNEN